MNMEAYMDDILVRSVRDDLLTIDLREAFVYMWRHNIRLNLTKCAFGVKSGIFLGFMISEGGIKDNPNKFKASEEMKVPTCHKEVQTLNGLLIMSIASFQRRAIAMCHSFQYVGQICC